MKTFFSIDDAVKTPMESDRVFIIANERIRKDGGIGRCYTVFPSFNHFVKDRDKYPHCHEIIADHCNNEPNIGGRLTFDFDIEDVTPPKDFKAQVEATIELIAIECMKDVDPQLFVYVWSTSPNPKKVSKHLTVKNCYFVNWIPMSKLFYKHFTRVWDETYTWISGNDLVDSQIARNRGTLRMVGSKKIGGNVLTLDDEEHGLQDALIRIYNPAVKKYEQHVNVDQLLPLPSKINMDGASACNTVSLCLTDSYAPKYPDALEQEIPKEIYDMALEIFMGLKPMKGVFAKRNINGPFIYLNRLKKAKCLMSTKIHEKEHACLIIRINEYTNDYEVRFKCFRGEKCNSKRKTVLIASINHFTQIPEVLLDFD